MDSFFQINSGHDFYGAKRAFLLFSSGAKIDFHFLQAKGLDKTLKMKRLLI